MAITYYPGATGEGYATCHSTDTKPTDVPAGFCIHEHDTGKQYEFVNDAWVEVINDSYATSAQGITTTLSILRGGTGASNAGVARTNLGLGTAATAASTDFATASHTHDTADLASGTLATIRLGSTGWSNAKFYRGDQTWATVSGGATAWGDISGTLSDQTDLLLQSIPGSISLGAQTGTLPLLTGVRETLAIQYGGTGAANAGVARTNLGLGALAVADSVAFSAVTGSISLGAQSGDLQLTDVSGTLAVQYGGTGASNAAVARTNLGVTLDNISGSISLGAQAGSLELTDVLGTLAVVNGGTGASNAAVARTNLGISFANTTGSVSLGAQSGDLQLTDVSGTLAVVNGGTGASNGPAAYTNLGLMATTNLSGSISLIAQSGSLPLATGVTGTLSVANGGTGGSRETGTGDMVKATSPTFVTKITLPAGDATNAPLVFGSGSAQTTPGAGSVTYNGQVFLAAPVASGIGVIPAIQWISNTASVAIATNTTALQSPFNANNDVITVSANTTYYFQGLIEITGMSATTRTTSMAFGGTATYTNIKWISYIGTGAANAIATVNSSKTNVAASAQVLNATVATAAETIDFSGIMRIANAGTVIPQISHSAILGSTANCIQGSYFKIFPIGSNTTSAVGNFS